MNNHLLASRLSFVEEGLRPGTWGREQAIDDSMTSEVGLMLHTYSHVSPAAPPAGGA